MKIMTALDTGAPRVYNRTPRAEKQQPAPTPMSPRDGVVADAGVNTNQQVAGTAGAALVPAQKAKKTRTGYITERTSKDVAQILTVLNANFVNKTFRLSELMELLPQTLLDSWENPALDLNRFIKRVMGLPEVGKADNTGTRGRRPNLYHYSGTYVQKRVHVPGSTTEPEKSGKRRGPKPRNQQPVQQSARDAGTPAGTNPVVDQTPSNVVALTPATQNQPVASYEEKHNVNGVDYYLGGESNFVRRTALDPQTKHMVAAVFDLKANAFHRVNDDIVRLPKKERAKK